MDTTTTDFYKKLEAAKRQREAEAKAAAPAAPAVVIPVATLTPAAAPTPQPEETPAIKYDDGKPRYDLIPPEALDGLARLYGLGAGKYDDRNWEKGLNWSRVFAAMMRHAWKWFRGEDYDRTDGQHHLLSVIWCAMALYTYFVRGAGHDDRPPEATLSDTYETAWWQNPQTQAPQGPGIRDHLGGRMN